MSTETFDITLQRNADFSRGFTLTDDAEPPVPLDLTGATFDMDIRYTAGVSGAPLVDVPIVCETPVTGYFEFTLSGSMFINIGNPVVNARFVYDIIATQDGRRIPLVSGNILLLPGVSNNEA